MTKKIQKTIVKKSDGIATSGAGTLTAPTFDFGLVLQEDNL